MNCQYHKETQYDFIWNITLVCPWDCEFCCTDAAYVRKQGKEIIIQERSLTSEVVVKSECEKNSMIRRIKLDGYRPNKFDYALVDRQQRKKEITFEEKISALENLKGSNLKIDFAGGDPLSCYENYLIIKYASELFGKGNISITSTGFSINRYGVDLVSNIIGEFEFTLDETNENPAQNRPSGYNASNIFYAKKFSENNIKTKAQLPIHSGNIDPVAIENIYTILADAEIDELLLMRTFPVGRGRIFLMKEGMYNRDDYRKVINLYREMEMRYQGPKVRLQCALKNLESSEGDPNPCDLMRESYGINPRGKLLLSAWATNDIGEPLSDDFVLGNLYEKSFVELLESPKAKKYFKKLDQNFGHCKIFSHIFSPNQGSDGIFEKNDPLYT